MLLEQTIRGISVELAQLKAADVELRNHIVEEVRKLERLEKEVRPTLWRNFDPTILTYCPQIEAISGKVSAKRKRCE